jgi:hypothetical protein
MPFIALYAVTLINVLVAAGFAISGIAETERETKARVYALYAAARTIALALAVVVAMLAHSGEAVLWLGLLGGIVQLLDGGIGIVQRNVGKTFGPLVIAIIQFAVLYPFLTD